VSESRPAIRLEDATGGPGARYVIAAVLLLLEADMPANAVTIIHKYLRRELFDVSEQLFRACPSHIDGVRAALERIDLLLHTHAAQEDARLYPLLHRVDPQLAKRMKADHERLDDRFAFVYDAARLIDATQPDCREKLLQLHLDWNRFVGEYLLHLDDEERTLFPAIRDALPPLSSLAQSARDQGANGEEFLLRLWAVTTMDERAQIEGTQ
jgi:iron-sulfur cluster repair protein YtfE (RIC family)